MASDGQISHRGRMPGRASQSWCPACRSTPGRDCPDVAKTPRQVRRRLHRELDREIREALMGRLTDDPNDPELTHGVDPEGTVVPQAGAYLVLSEEERAKGFVRPVRRSYRHTTCGAVTTMSAGLAETYAREPGFYGATYCCSCQRHAPVREFRWDEHGDDTDPIVGS